MSQITPQRQQQENVTEFRFIRYGVAIFVAICVVVAFFILRKTPGYISLNLSLLIELIILISLFIFGYIGFIVGDFLRHWVMPSHFIANDFYTLVQMKIFWKIGPQLVGMIIGGAIPLFVTLEMFR